MDIYHTGKEDAADDHKFINERLLEVGIPPEHPDGSRLTLEECLEAYFNNRIEVKRYLERRSTLNSVKSFDSTSKGFYTHVETLELGPSSPLSPRSDATLPTTPTIEAYSYSDLSRRTSIVQERFIPEGDGDEKGFVKGSGSYRGRPRKGSIRKEVMMPAWQFFSLIRMCFKRLLRFTFNELSLTTTQLGIPTIRPQAMRRLPLTSLPNVPYSGSA